MRIFLTIFSTLLLFLTLLISSCTTDLTEEYSTSDDEFLISTRHCSDGYLQPSFIDDEGCCHFILDIETKSKYRTEEGTVPRDEYIVCPGDEPIHLTRFRYVNGQLILYCDLILDCSCNVESGNVIHTIVPMGGFGDCCYFRITVTNTYSSDLVIKNLAGDIEVTIPGNSTGAILEQVCAPQTEETFYAFITDCEGNEVNVYDITIFHNC
jgi:hypothetical protein